MKISLRPLSLIRDKTEEITTVLRRVTLKFKKKKRLGKGAMTLLVHWHLLQGQSTVQDKCKVAILEVNFQIKDRQDILLLRILISLFYLMELSFRKSTGMKLRNGILASRKKEERSQTMRKTRKKSEEILFWLLIFLSEF